MKLTGPQTELLADLAQRERHVPASYTPLRKLIALGLAEHAGTQWTGGDLYAATDAGRAVLEASRASAPSEE